jgi:hypothetical protein
MPKESFHLTIEDKKQLLKIARDTIIGYLQSGKIPVIEKQNLSQHLISKCGAFVTLHKNGSLRGCIGRFTANDELFDIVQQMAVASATNDSRFSKVGQNEIDLIDIEISVLTPLRKIESIDEIEVGKHGIYIKKGFSTGTFLPQVAIETGWTKEEFLGYCSKNKAGIGWEGWKDAEIFTYEAIVFGEKELNQL